MSTATPLQTSALQEPRFAVCGIGLSAGGLSALREFFTRLGVVEGVSFVVAQHQLAADPGNLNILASFSPYPVMVCEDGMPIEAGRLYVVPGQVLVGFEGQTFTIRPLQSKYDHLRTIDYFLRALGTSFGERSIGIVFSGNSSDGTQGLVSVAAAGGFTLAQSHDTAQYNTMPASAVAIGVVDTVGSPHELATAVRDHIGKLSQPKLSLRALAKQELHEVCDVVRQATGLDFRHYKESTLFRRIVRRINVLRFGSARDYIDYLLKKPEEARLLTRDLLIGVTSFFRDPEAFASLEQKVLMRLIAADRTDNVRIWVAGCGSGQEAYSLAMLAQEVKQATGSRQELQIFATDLDERALAAARRGIYPSSVADEVSAERLERFFERVGRRYRVKKELRQLVVFSPHNLIADPPFSRMDLISCRNLLIYLGAPLQKKLMSVFHYALRGSGFLFLGSSEATSGHPDLFRVIDGRSRIAQRKETVVGNAGMSRVIGGGQSSWQSIVAEEPADIGRIAQRILLDEFAPSYALAHEDGQVIYLSGKVGQFMQPPEGHYVNHIMRMARPSLRGGLRAAWTRALKSKRTSHYDGISIEEANVRRRIRITVQPMPQLGENDSTYMIVFNDLGPAEGRDGLMSAASVDNERMVELLEADLIRTREDLERAVQDLEAANEELKSSNEELLSMNEELQSANEELETSKEEIESAKQALEESNADLLNLLRSTEIATIFLDASGAVRNFTPSVSKLYNVVNSDIGRPLSHFTHNFDQLPPMPTAPEIAAADAPQEVEARTVDGRTFLRRVTPYRNAEGVPVGTVVTFIDISDRKLVELRLATKDAVTRALAESHSLELAGQRILAEVCERWDWQCGLLWCVEPTDNRLHCLQTYHAPNFATPKLDEFLRTRSVAQDEGVAGDVLQSGKPTWVADLSQDARFKHAHLIENSSLRSALAFPIVLGGQKLGVFVFLCARVRSSNPGLLKMAEIIGSQVGVFIERSNAEQALRLSEARYRAVVETQGELICRFTSDGTILFVNEAYARSQALTPDQLVGTSLWEIIPQDDQPMVRELIQRLTPQTPEVRIENRVITKAGIRWYLWTNHALQFDAQGHYTEAQSTGVDITERKAAENHRQLLIDELNHRVKNTLAVVQGIAQQTFNNESSSLDARTAFYGRLAALGTAHGLLSQQSWERVDLAQLARSAIDASGAPSARVSIGGPAILLEPKHALAIALALHELCTNAIKYGALSNESGKLELTWQALGGAEPRLKLRWREFDGPPVAPPARRGFGSMMIERALAHELGCNAQLQFSPDGVQCTIEAPLHKPN